MYSVLCWKEHVELRTVCVWKYEKNIFEISLSALIITTVYIKVERVVLSNKQSIWVRSLGKKVGDKQISKTQSVQDWFYWISWVLQMYSSVVFEMPILQYKFFNIR